MQKVTNLVHTLIPRRGMRQLIKFSFVGVFNTFIDYSIYLLLTRVFFVYLLVANACAIGVAMIFSFFANKHFTFRQGGGDIQRQITRFLVVQGIGFVLANTYFYLGVILGAYDIVAKIMGSIIFTTWNFLAQKYWAFKV